MHKPVLGRSVEKVPVRWALLSFSCRSVQDRTELRSSNNSNNKKDKTAFVSPQTVYGTMVVLGVF